MSTIVPLSCYQDEYDALATLATDTTILSKTMLKGIEQYKAGQYSKATDTLTTAQTQLDDMFAAKTTLDGIYDKDACTVSGDAA
jgi:DNA polymerase/3'-5' exonuclease PolX